MPPEPVRQSRAPNTQYWYATGNGAAGWTKVSVATPTSGMSLYISAIHIYIEDTLDIKIYDMVDAAETLMFLQSPAVKDTWILRFPYPLKLGTDHILRVWLGGAANAAHITAIGFEQ